MNYVLFAASSFALFIIAITMLCRANDLRWRKGFKWQVRFVGFALTGSLPLGVVINEWHFQQWPSPYEAFFRIGLMLVFVTTPYLPPWWAWIKGDEDATGAN